MTTPDESRSFAAPLTLAAVFGPGVAYVPRRSFTLHGWSPPAPGFVDFQTGHQLAVAGGVPYVVCAGVATPEILALIQDAGLSVDAELHPYRTAREYAALLRHLGADGFAIATQRVHPADEVPDAVGLVPLSVQQDLNNKGCMADIVPASWLPKRRVIERSALPGADVVLAEGPVVLKAATSLPNGGGFSVFLCQSAAEVERARAALAAERTVVVEELLTIERSVCVHGVVPPDGTVVLAGVAEQVCHGARWDGNWLDDDAEGVGPDVLDVVVHIGRAAAARGYRGIFGVDVAFAANGRALVIDLNFRVNGSTAATWLRQRLARERGARCMRLRSWKADDHARLCSVVRRETAGGALVPLGLYDPAASAIGGAPRLHGLVVGSCREDVEDALGRLARQGLV
jgi:hypothetical protein